MVLTKNIPLFYNVMDALGKYKDAQCIYELFIKVIEVVGVNACAQIITNNAPICNTNGMIVETKYPQIFWPPCIVHSLNLVIKLIASYVTWMGTLIDDACHIRNFVQNHTNSLTTYKHQTNLSLLKIGYSQFSSLVVMIKRLKEVKTTHGGMAISKFWYFWRNTYQKTLVHIIVTILDDGWWERVDLIVNIMDYHFFVVVTNLS
jgi:hypothetical protein